MKRLAVIGVAVLAALAIAAYVLTRSQPGPQPPTVEEPPPNPERWAAGGAPESMRPPPGAEARPMAPIRPADPATAIAIPERVYPVLPGELVVLLKPGGDVDSFRRSLGDAPITVVGSVSGFGVVQVEVTAAQREALKALLEANPLVARVIHQALLRPNVRFNDPVFANDDPHDDWWLKAIDVEAAWEVTRGRPDVIIAIIDHGTLLDHEELKGKIVRPASLRYESLQAQESGADVLRHGTHVAAIAAGAGDNGVGTSGVCPGCSVMPIQARLAVDFAAAVAYAIDNGASVINVSMGFMGKGTLRDWREPKSRRRLEASRDDLFYFFNRIFETAEASGVTVVVSAGNANAPGDFEPSCYSPFTLCVGNARQAESGAIAPSPDTNYGFMVRVSAPGSDILSAVAEPGGRSYAYLSGTSMAAPVVAGLAGLVLSANPKLPPWRVKQAILASAHAAPPDGGPRVRLHDGARRARRVLGAYERAFLRLLGKDEEALLGDQAQHHLASLVSAHRNRVWLSSAAKAMGACVDACAALEIAASGAFRARFARFSRAEIERAMTIDPDILDRLADLLRFEGAYAGSAQTGGPFAMHAEAPFDPLSVSREVAPGGDYREELIFIAPGRYSHRASLDGADYSRGEVEIDWKGGALVIVGRHGKARAVHRPK